MTLLALTLLACGLSDQSASAISKTLVINQVQLGPTGSASHEFIELYNLSPEDVEVTNWCLYYAPAASLLQGSKLTCLAPESAGMHLFLPPGTSIFMISRDLATSAPLLGNDGLFSVSLAGTAGHLRLLDATNSEIDKLGWGAAAVSAEGFMPALVPTGGMVLKRVKSPLERPQDTDNNSVDFRTTAASALYSYGNIYDVRDVCANIDGIQEGMPVGYSLNGDGACVLPPVDVCENIDGLQVVVPDGYELDGLGLCQIDDCLNIDGLQLGLPAGKEYDIDGNCVDHDVCTNMTGIQATLPTGYVHKGFEYCVRDLLDIRLSELLPNAKGTDAGSEFIEIYNPHDVSIDLSLYVLQIGLEAPKSYSFPVGSKLEPNGYLSLSNDEMPFTLVNTTSKVSILSVDGELIDGSPAYEAPADGQSWAYINNQWQYTNVPTPGAGNTPSLIFVEEVDEEVAFLKPCAPNQYRNPDTNRCRILVALGSSLTPCRDGQYRSETTNRCRSIASDALPLVACASNQERNLETNRCRLIASTSPALTACKEGQERNPETNRCRNVSVISAAAYPVEPVGMVAQDNTGWWALAAIGGIALGYGVWEWRSEINLATRKLRSFMHQKK